MEHVRPVKNHSTDITLFDGHQEELEHHLPFENHQELKVEGERQREWSGPVTYTLTRKDDSYGFTLRYFVVYPPTPQKQDYEDETLDKGFNRDSYWLENGLDCEDDDDEAFEPYKPAPLDTFFVKSVTPGGSADDAGLRSGDRIVSINGDLIGGKTYKDVVELIQYCSGDLKLGVVPHQEDILQLVYQEYIYDGLKQQNGDDLKQRHSTSTMPQPSINKWSAPLSPRKSLTIDNNNGLPSPVTMSHGAGEGSGSSDSSSKRYDPCVGFFAGTPIIKLDNKQSRSNSITSSGGSNTPNRAGKMSGRASPKRSSSSATDPCVSWVAGKPMVNVQEEEGKENNENYGVPPYKLQNALRKEQGKKPYSVGTRLAPKQIAGVSKPGAVSNIAGLFASGNWDELSSTNRKKSATSVLRDDFQMKSVHKKSIDDTNEHGPMKFNLNINVDSKRRTSEPSENETNRVQFDRSNSNYGSGRYQRTLSSNTSQATLVESKDLKPKEGVSALVSNTIMINGGRDKTLSPVTYRKRNLLRGGRKVSVSSVENSEEDDSHGESGDEGELNNWKGRRISYLAATSKQKENEKAVAKKDDKVPDDADDEDSDATASPTTNRLKFTGQKQEEGETKPVIKEGPLNRKLEKSLDSRKKPSGRTWKPMYAVLKGHRLFCYKNSGDGDDDIIQPIPIRGSNIEIASDYGKRRHVFRLVTSHGNEYLFQSEDTAAMMSWVQTLWEANPDKESSMKIHQQVKHEEHDQKLTKDNNKKGLSIKRTPFLRSSKKGRSSSAQAKSSNKTELSPCSPPGKTFGIPLHKCPVAINHEKVPLIVEHCCTVIEDKADVIGIYRIPGNAATISALRIELDSKNPEEIQWDEEKWQEVHNISSLLKSFIRQLDDPIVPSNMYTRFITVNRFQDQRDRLKSIKHLTRELPEYHFETLQFLMRHLKIIVEHSEKNKMDLKNLVMLFGPNIVKSDEVTSLVQDMPDQCKIIETLIKQYDWIFLNDAEGGEPIDLENDGDIISADVSRALTECLNNNNNNNQKNVTEQEINEIVIKKSNKFSTLRNNISMKLKSTKVTSPKSEKKKSGNVSQDEEMETDDDTSGTYSQSPPLSGKSDKRENKFKTRETRTVGKLTVTLNNQRDPEIIPGRVTTKLGSIAMNSDVQMNFSSHPRSPELSPTMARKDIKLTEKTLNRINQLGMAQNTQEFEYKINSKDDGNDSGVTSPQRLDSDDSDSGAHSSRKESFESLSGPSPRMQRCFPASALQRQLSNSGSSNEERSPTLQKASMKVAPSLEEKENNDRSVTVINRSKRRANKSKVLNEQKNEIQTPDTIETKKKSSKVVKRSDSAIRRRMHPNSPRPGKRDIKSIIPGDADELEEQLRVLLHGDGVTETEITESRTFELSQKPNTLEIPSDGKPVVLSGFKTPDSGHNAEWWLSGSQNNYRRFLNTPKDKASAVNILTTVIDSSRKRNSKEREEIDNMTDGQQGSDFTTLVANHRQRNDELQRKVTDILSTSPVSSYTDLKNYTKRDPISSKQTRLDSITPPSLTSNSASSIGGESRSEKIDKYLQQVAFLLGESDDTQEIEQERERIANILKQFQSSAAVPPPGREKQRLKSDSSGTVNQHKTVHRSRSATVNVKSERTSPLLDDAYCNLNYNKLYPR